jgi:hypothetical protein
MASLLRERKTRLLIGFGPYIDEFAQSLGKQSGLRKTGRREP